jgi:hypothetical protein
MTENEIKNKITSTYCEPFGKILVESLKLAKQDGVDLSKFNDFETFSLYCAQHIKINEVDIGVDE